MKTPGNQQETGLTQSVRRIAATVMEALRMRTQLALLEGKEAALRLLVYLVLALAAVVLFFTGWLMVNVLLVVIFQAHAILTAAILIILNVLGGAGLLALTWHRFHADGPFFAATMEELKRDRQLIGGNHDAAD